jgi:hypothetical protein
MVGASAVGSSIESAPLLVVTVVGGSIGGISINGLPFTGTAVGSAAGGVSVGGVLLVVGLIGAGSTRACVIYSSVLVPSVVTWRNSIS